MIRYKSRDWTKRIARAQARTHVSNEGLIASLDCLGVDGLALMNRVWQGESHLSVPEVFAFAVALNAPPEWLTGENEDAPPLTPARTLELSGALSTLLRMSP